MKKTKAYECTVSMSYNAESPADAAKQFLDNIASNPNWYVEVKEINGTGVFTVDTETDEIVQSN